MLTVLLATTTSRRWTCASRVSTGPRTRPRCSQHNSIAADALRCGRRRPRQAGAARGAVFESMRPVEGRLRAFALRLRCSALSSSPAQQRLRAQFKLSVRRVCTSLVIYVAIYAGARRARDHLSNRELPQNCFASNPACAVGYVSGAQTHAWGGPGLSWVAWPTRRRRATAAARAVSCAARPAGSISHCSVLLRALASREKACAQRLQTDFARASDV